ncbi:Aste57867_17137 [Aphanomyces stellatus]|uniref:Aste57867_17137 protein n=1 Tax=Aphanomyces stellatus TaxID=120398 RepID=A0A485L7U6_9STRA|nr:hypothetical protein As57867_017078 [Aphanomyces stellatus]VFT93895.1 Aste57867_17137 [Aphanomyces stellatus]
MEGGVYPIKIDVASKECMSFMAMNMHLIQGGIQFLKVANSAAGMLSMFGIPSVDKETIHMVEGLMEFPANSVQNFQVVEKALSGESVNAVRGSALRELKQFFEVHDPNQSYSGLKRAGGEDDKAVWTCEEETH